MLPHVGHGKWSFCDHLFPVYGSLATRLARLFPGSPRRWRWFANAQAEGQMEDKNLSSRALNRDANLISAWHLH